MYGIQNKTSQKQYLKQLYADTQIVGSTQVLNGGY